VPCSLYILWEAAKCFAGWRFATSGAWDAGGEGKRSKWHQSTNRPQIKVALTFWSQVLKLQILARGNSCQAGAVGFVPIHLNEWTQKQFCARGRPNMLKSREEWRAARAAAAGIERVRRRWRPNIRRICGALK